MCLGGAGSRACAVLLVCFLTLRPAGGRQCLSQSLEDVVIDIQSSLARGVRGSEPTHTPGPQECIASCCSTRNISGDKACNLMIFDTRKTINQPNCYLFFCPSADACPLKPAKGLRSYRVIEEPLSSPTRPELSSPGRWDQAAPSSSPPTARGSSKPADVLREDVSSQTSGTSGHLEKLLPGGSASPGVLGSEGEAHPPSSHFSPEPTKALLEPENGAALSTPAATATRRPPTSASRPPAAPGIPSVARPQAATAAGPVTTVPTQPPTGLPATVWTGAVTSAPARPTMTAMTRGTGTRGTGATATSQATTGLQGAPHVVPFPETSSLPWNSGATHEAVTLPPSRVDSAPASETSSGKAGQRLGAASLDRGPGGRYSLPFDKWLLVGSLVLGVLFLAIGLVLMGRKFVESLHRKRYSRLDYLINGIYVDI
ncbi:MANSC domain-containing protein 1 [Sorex araneus]|uniref:MANSC domain-containing protein 1 n=1 Tax=Sorex araneus TaxID=42254 RepID=UPI00243360C5|nr:MANSC domain-containing protein 1 [Sorex araneus]